MAPELVSLALGALAIPLAVLVLLRWKKGQLACTSLLVIAAALLAASAGVFGVTLLLLFGIPVAALYRSLAGGQGPADPPGIVPIGQLLVWVALICLALTASQTYQFALTFTYTDVAEVEPFPGLATALALACAISLTVLAVAIAKLRNGTDSNPTEAIPSR